MAAFTCEDAGTPRTTREAQAERQDRDERLVLAGLERELVEALAEMKKYAQMDPADVMLSISSWHARALEIRDQLQASTSRRADAFRTRRLDPYLEGCEFQFKIHSRLHSTRQFDWDLTKGQG